MARRSKDIQQENISQTEETMAEKRTCSSESEMDTGFLERALSSYLGVRKER